jgi:hypothetical protein
VNFLGKLQRLSDRERRVILWVAVTIVGGILFYFWLQGLDNKISSVRDGDRKLIPLDIVEEVQQEAATFELPSFKQLQSQMEALEKQQGLELETEVESEIYQKTNGKEN